jgi:hypothetical protein
VPIKRKKKAKRAPRPPKPPKEPKEPKKKAYKWRPAPAPQLKPGTFLAPAEAAAAMAMHQAMQVQAMQAQAERHLALQAQLQASEVVDAPRALRDFRSGVRDPVHLPYVNQSKLALAVSCAARLAQAHAHERVWRRVGAAPRSWKLYVSSDSPAVRSLLEQLPELRGHVIGCFPLRCTHPSLRGGSWRTPSEDQTLALATDLWMLGAADATMAVSSTTLVYWSTRSPPRDGRTQWLSRSPVPTLGNKMVPVCAGSTPTDE